MEKKNTWWTTVHFWSPDSSGLLQAPSFGLGTLRSIHWTYRSWTCFNHDNDAICIRLCKSASRHHHHHRHQIIIIIIVIIIIIIVIIIIVIIIIINSNGNGNNNNNIIIALSSDSPHTVCVLIFFLYIFVFSIPRRKKSIIIERWQEFNYTSEQNNDGAFKIWIETKSGLKKKTISGPSVYLYLYIYVIYHSIAFKGKTQ